MADDDVPSILRDAFSDFDPHETVEQLEETSPRVSTNRVYRLSLASGRTLFAKVSSYGSFVHFRQDHVRIHQWIELLRGSRYEHFLAPVLLKNGEVYTFEREGEWVVFYDEARRRGILPRVLSDGQLDNLGREMALFHRTCSEVSQRLDPTWQSLGSDLAALYDQMTNAASRAAHTLSLDQARLVRRHCDLFFANAERLGYHRTPKIPVLIDWNRGNFSVAYDEDGFRLHGRWDYDWFRIEPRAMDFYFFSRVVRAEGDQTVFSYTASPLLEPRFVRFLRAYHGEYALTEREVLFLKEAYRFFVLNYVLRTGQHFFVPEFCGRLQREAVDRYLPELETFDISPLLEALA
jgi:hypothetical protein